MSFFNQFEQKFQKYAIRNLMYYIVILYGIGLVIQLTNPMIYWTYLCLNPYMILHGQVWRIVTFLVYPPALGSSTFTSVFYGIIALFLYYSLGQTLERVWGAFRFNFFFFTGVILQVLADLVTYLVTGSNLAMTTGYLNFSIFLAFAIYFPDIQFLLFFVIPIKAKWLAVAECAVYVYSFVFGSLGTRLEIAISLANVLIFVLLTRNYRKYSPKEIRRKQAFKREVKMMPQGRTRHRCAVCGRTEEDDPNLEFRYCSKCEGDYEYCQDHLYTHRHVTGEK
ncbi:MAG: hypothetical protein LUC94_07815 [Clostridiales bacterium]|nr:hypothetical protein [Clostridiales bacterium]